MSIQKQKQKYPQSIDEMQDMSPEELCMFDGLMKNNELRNSTVEERVEELRNSKNREVLEQKSVIRAVIKLASKKVSWKGKERANSLREFWYNPVKPIVTEIFPDKDDSNLNDRLSTELGDMIKEGQLTYEDLNIVDESRERELRRSGVESDKILFVEKDSAYRKLKKLPEIYDINLISGSGFNSLACTEAVAKELDTDRQYDIFVLTDYDPTGFDIRDSFKDQLETYGFDINSYTHIGIKPSQLDEETIDRQLYTPPKEEKHQREWVEEYGIDGKYGLEIEAYGDMGTKGEALRKFVVEELKPHIDTRQHIQRDVQQAKDGLGEAVAHHIYLQFRDEIIGGLREDLMDRAREIGTELDSDIETYDGEELHESAIKGTEQPTVDSQQVKDQIRQQLKQEISTGEITVEDYINTDIEVNA